jgi:hypothetical protein
MTLLSVRFPLFRFASGLLLGVLVSASALTLTGVPSGRADSPGSPVWVLNAIADYQPCSDWKNDTNLFPGSSVPINYYWSGQPQWWNYPTANVCWHNDEVSSSWWRAIDIPAPAPAAVLYRATIYASDLTPGQSYSTSSCGGVQVDIWTPNGAYAGAAHYWHIVRDESIIGTNTAQHFYYPGQTVHIKQLGTVRPYGTDSCSNTGDHVHQAVYQSGWAQPNKDGAVTWGSMSFGW